MSTGLILMVLVGLGAFCLGVVGCFLISQSEQQRRSDVEARRLMQQPWDAQGPRANR